MLQLLLSGYVRTDGITVIHSPIVHFLHLHAKNAILYYQEIFLESALSMVRLVFIKVVTI